MKGKNSSDIQKVKEKKSSFMTEYKWWIIVFSVILVICYGVIYLCFSGKGVIPSGIEMEKRDWLSFLGSYLGFSGTAIVSIVAIFQSRFYTKQERERSKDERKRDIQPILSVDITAKDSQISGTSEVFNINDPQSFPKHKNITITIENVGEYPIRNVIIFDKYLWQLLKPNEKKQVQVAYSDSPDAKRWKKHIIELIESDYERSSAGIPKWFNVNYDDIDGNEMFQTYELKEFDETFYYTLEGTHEI